MPAPGPEGVHVRGVVTSEYATILTPDALAFVAGLARRHTDTVHELLARRKAVQARYDAGGRPHFLPQTKHVRLFDRVGPHDWLLWHQMNKDGPSRHGVTGCKRPSNGFCYTIRSTLSRQLYANPYLTVQ